MPSPELNLRIRGTEGYFVTAEVLLLKSQDAVAYQVTAYAGTNNF